MKRLLKISFDTTLLSFIPILSWFILSIVVDTRLLNIFTLIYPIQFLWCILKCIFSNGANLSKEIDKNSNAVMSGIAIGSIVGAVIFGVILINIESYIRFMNMDVDIYKAYSVYYVIQLYLQLILAFILNKLYFEEKNTLANKYSFGFNVINFVVLIGGALIFKNTTLVILLTLISLSIYTIIISVKTFERFKLKFNLLKFIKYDSVELFNNVAFFIIYLFGLSNALEFGEEYALAITFIALITDTQWDVIDSIGTVAKIDVSKDKFNYIEHRDNAYKLLLLLFLSTAIMFVCLYGFYELNMPITFIFLSFEVVGFALYPIYKIKTCFLQLKYSAVKTTTNKMVASGTRTLLSFLKTPYCTGIGQVYSAIYQYISINIMFHKNYAVGKDGAVIRKTKNK